MIALVLALSFFGAPKVIMTAPVAEWADVTVQADAAHLSLVNVRRGKFDKPTQVPRYRGRFLARALDGAGKTLEEVRFELPLMAEAETDDASDEARRYAEKLRANVSVKSTVRVPLPEGTDHIEIVDTLKKRTLTVPLATAAAAAPSPGPAARAGAPPAR
jgi:hypothetical protein